MGLIWFPMFQYSQFLSLERPGPAEQLLQPGIGGSVWLYENLFWLLGHPEVYVIVIPGTAALMELMTVFMRKPLFSYKMAIAGIFGVVGISGVVWVHHMYMTGFAPAANYPFMLSTELISIPFGFLVLVLLGTIWRGKVWTRLPMMAVYAVIWNKVVGGITGVWLSDVPVDQYMHGSMFVVAHFHFMLMGAALVLGDRRDHLLVPQDDRRYLNERIGSIGFWLAFADSSCASARCSSPGCRACHVACCSSMMRSTCPTGCPPSGPTRSVSARVIFLYAIITSWRSGQPAPSNPWAANTLEWQVPTPGPAGELRGAAQSSPTGPYNYGVPDPYAATRTPMQARHAKVGAK